MLQNSPRSTPAVILGEIAAALLLLGIAAGCARTPVRDPHYVGQLELADTLVEITEIATVPGVPWELTMAPDGWLWFTELAGTVTRLNPDTGESRVVLTVPDVFHRKSQGLLSMVLHPRFEAEPYVYLHYVYQVPADDNRERFESRVMRYRWNGSALAEPTVIFDAIPGATYHNGSRLVIGPDDKLYVTTGDSGRGGTQDPAQLNGKVLRLNLDGSVPADNPWPANPVWSMGHRNGQGLVLAPNGHLYESEHGPNNDDEINLIRRGANYGWPEVAGFIDHDNEKAFAAGKDITEPLFAWTPTLGNAGLDYYGSDAIPEWKGSLLLVNLKGRALRVLGLSADGERVEGERIYFQKWLGRMRDLCVAPNGDIYLATSNTDWHPRFQPWMYPDLPTGPDRILRLRAADAATRQRLAARTDTVIVREDPEPLSLLSEDWSFPATTEDLMVGQGVYAQHCVACHSPTGMGASDLIPPLGGTDWVTGDKNRLIHVVLAGMRGPVEVNGTTYNQEMPAFAHLPDDEIAAVLTFVRQSFGNDANAVIPGEVFEERKTLP